MNRIILTSIVLGLGVFGLTGCMQHCRKSCSTCASGAETGTCGAAAEKSSCPYKQKALEEQSKSGGSCAESK